MIDRVRIKDNLKNFAFPRLSGTKFEFEAFNKLKQIIQGLDLKFIVQSFTFSSFYSRLYPKIAFLSVSLILLLLYLNYATIFSIIVIFVLVGLLIISILITRRPEKIHISPKFSSQNLLLKINPKSNKVENKGRIILFMSHIDSKGQRFKVQIRIKIIKSWIYTSIILLIIVFFKNLIFPEIETLLYIIGLFPLIINVGSTIMMVFNNTNNCSDGAVDNASGLVCNLELVNYYAIAENRLDNYSIWFLFTGAEECGTMGIRHFYNTLNDFNPNKSIIFNFESIAKHVYLFPGGSEGNHAKTISNLLLNNNRELTINFFITKRIFGTHSDGGFLGDRGFQGYGIGGVETHAYMHTLNDTIDKVDTNILEKLCLSLTDSLKEHDRDFRNFKS